MKQFSPGQEMWWDIPNKSHPVQLSFKNSINCCLWHKSVNLPFKYMAQYNLFTKSFIDFQPAGQYISYEAAGCISTISPRDI